MRLIDADRLKQWTAAAVILILVMTLILAADKGKYGIPYHEE